MDADSYRIAQELATSGIPVRLGRSLALPESRKAM